MSREKDLVKNTFLLSLGRFLPKLMHLVTLPIMTACLSKAEYGTVDLVSTLIMLLIPIATLQIQSAAFRFLIDVRGDVIKSSEVISNILALVLPISALVAIGIFVFYPGYGLFFRAVLAFYFWVDSMLATLIQFARGFGRNRVYSTSAVIHSWTGGIAIVLVLKVFDYGLNGLVVCWAASCFLSLVYLVSTLKLRQYIDFHLVSKQKIKEMISYSWPLLPNSLSNWALKMSDRMVIRIVWGLEATAVYGVANKVPNILALAHSVIVNAWQENASITVNDEDACDYYSKIFHHIFCLMIGFTAILIAFTPIIFRVFIRGDYEEAYVQLPILILAMFFYCISGFQGAIYVAHKRTKSVGITTVIAAVINLAIDILLVKPIGITAGSVSTLVAYFFLYIYRTFDSRKFQKLNYNFKKIGFLFGLVTVMLLLCFFKNFYLNCINMAAGIVLFSILNKEIIVNIISKGKSFIKKH